MATRYFDPNYHGTDRYWKASSLSNLVITDSVKDFCEEHEAFWLVDAIDSYYITKLRKIDTFFVCFCDVKDSKAKLYIRQDTDMPDVAKQNIPFTDLDVSVKLYLVDNVLMFPSDY